jgi:acetolactate synthase regulatory subunit
MTWHFELRAAHQSRMLSRVLQILESQMVSIHSVVLLQDGPDADVAFTISSQDKNPDRIQALLYRLQDVHSVRVYPGS